MPGNPEERRKWLPGIPRSRKISTISENLINRAQATQTLKLAEKNRGLCSHYKCISRAQEQNQKRNRRCKKGHQHCRRGSGMSETVNGEECWETLSPRQDVVPFSWAQSSCGYLYRSCIKPSQLEESKQGWGGAPEAPGEHLLGSYWQSIAAGVGTCSFWACSPDRFPTLQWMAPCPFT